ncbi:hypothetical protein AHF37_02470 [Paragonimus kellicotti]|nr:hypothetical protein AHF37_02470 [Paragonimus kellicotti]
MDSHDVIVSSRLGMFFNAESREKTFRSSLCSVVAHDSSRDNLQDNCAARKDVTHGHSQIIDKHFISRLSDCAAQKMNNIDCYSMCVDIADVCITLLHHGHLLNFEADESKNVFERLIDTCLTEFSQFLSGSHHWKCINLLISILNVPFKESHSRALASSLVKMCKIILTLEELDPVWTTVNKWIDNFQFLQKLLSSILTLPVENDQLLPLFNPICELLAFHCVLLRKNFAAHLHSKNPPCFSAVELVTLCQLLTVWSQISSKLQEISIKSATSVSSSIISQQDSAGSQSVIGSTVGFPFSTVDSNTSFHSQPTDMTLPETLELNSDTSWLVCPSVVDLPPTRPRSVLKNQLGTQSTQGSFSVFARNDFVT